MSARYPRLLRACVGAFLVGATLGLANTARASTSIASRVATSANVRASRSARAVGRAGVPAFRHVFVVMMENLSYAGAMSTPGLVALARRYALATDYFAASHPSLPNYLAVTGGSTFGISSDCTACYVKAPNLLSQLAARRISARAYFEGLPSTCDLAPYAGGDYAGKHDPFRYFIDIRRSQRLCRLLQPAARLVPVLNGQATKAPRFVWFTPNLCDDGHDCSASTAAAWLTGFVREVTKSAAWKDDGVLFVTWDESEGSNAAVVPPGRVVGSGGGGQVMTLVIAPGLRRGLRVGVPYNHYSLLATIEDAFRLPLLRSAASARPMSAFFTTKTAARPRP